MPSVYLHVSYKYSIHMNTSIFIDKPPSGMWIGAAVGGFQLCRNFTLTKQYSRPRPSFWWGWPLELTGQFTQESRSLLGFCRALLRKNIRVTKKLDLYRNPILQIKSVHHKWWIDANLLFVQVSVLHKKKQWCGCNSKCSKQQMKSSVISCFSFIEA